MANETNAQDLWRVQPTQWATLDAADQLRTSGQLLFDAQRRFAGHPLEDQPPLSEPYQRLELSELGVLRVLDGVRAVPLGAP